MAEKSISLLQVAVQRTVRNINTNFWVVKGKMTSEQIMTVVKARKLIESILEA